MRWALRLLDDASDSLTALCVVRARGRPLARRAAAPAGSRPGRTAGRSAPAARWTSARARPTRSRASFSEEWQLEPERLSVEALLALPNGMTMLVGLATVADRCEPVPDAEHDEWAWWPADVDGWPAEADERLKLMAALLGS